MHLLSLFVCKCVNESMCYSFALSLFFWSVIYCDWLRFYYVLFVDIFIHQLKLLDECWILWTWNKIKTKAITKKSEQNSATKMHPFGSDSFHAFTHTPNSLIEMVVKTVSNLVLWLLFCLCSNVFLWFYQHFVFLPYFHFLLKCLYTENLLPDATSTHHFI